jgi:hypothetical protein
MLPFNTRGELLFCCDLDGADATIGSIREHSLAELVGMWVDECARLKHRRLDIITGGQIPPKFDTCTFCISHFANSEDF